MGVPDYGHVKVCFLVVDGHGQMVPFPLGYINPYEGDCAVIVGGGLEFKAGVKVVRGVGQPGPEVVVNQPLVER